MTNILPTNYLGLTVVAAIVTTTGAICSILIKDFFFVRYFENLKEKKTLKSISKRYKDPILLAAAELTRRLNELIKSYKELPQGFTQKMLFVKNEEMQSVDAKDPYFLKYKIISTLYRFSALFGWLEMFRQDITFLNSHSKKESNEFLKILGEISSCIADGQINQENDWQNWHDVLIFREELRAVGEGMIENNKDQKTVLGYGKFQLIIEEYETTNKPIWIKPVIRFFTGFHPDKDFRLKRLNILLERLQALMKCLDKEYYENHVEKILKMR